MSFSKCLNSFIFSVLITSCIQSKNGNISSSNQSEKPTSSIVDKNRFDEINFSKNATLNLTSEIELNFLVTNDWPDGALLIIQNLADEVLFYSTIKSKNDSYHLTVPFNQRELKVKVFRKIKGELIVEKIVQIKNGELRI